MVDQLTKDKKCNLKIYSMYRAISIDYLFYYVIEFLFLTQTKGLSESAVALSYTFYAISKIFAQMPINFVRNYIGNKKSILLGNFLNIFVLLTIMNCDRAITLYFASFLSAVAFSFKDVSDLSLLKLSMPVSENHSEIYAKSEAKGFRNYFLINAITSVFAGSLFIINAYLPLICSIILIIISIFIALAFKDIKIDKKQQQNNNTKKYLQELKKQNKFIFQSPRLRCLYLYIGLMTGIFEILNTYRTSLLVHINMPNYLITIVVAFVGITCSIGSKIQEKYARKFKNKSLGILIIYITFAMVILGILGKYMENSILQIVLICLVISSLGIVQGLENVLSNKYIGNFTNGYILPQILAVNDSYKYIFVALISGIGSILLNYFTITDSLLIFGIGTIIISIVLIIYMKPRLGLKDIEYTEKDIYDKNYIKKVGEKI